MSSAWPLCPPQTEEVRLCGHIIRVNMLAVPAFEIVALRAERTAYGAWLATPDSNPSPTGAYVCRNRRPYPETPVTWEHHSEHAHAVAADVNYDSNPISFTGYLHSDFDRFGFADGCDWLACWLEPPEDLPVFFRWGGGWTTDLAQACVNLRNNGERIRTGVCDAMHFELALTPDEVRDFDWKAAISEEEAVNKEIAEALEFVQEVRDGLKPGKDEATAAAAGRRVAAAVVQVEQAQEPTP